MLLLTLVIIKLIMRYYYWSTWLFCYGQITWFLTFTYFWAVSADKIVSENIETHSLGISSVSLRNDHNFCGFCWHHCNYFICCASFECHTYIVKLKTWNEMSIHIMKYKLGMSTKTWRLVTVVTLTQPILELQNDSLFKISTTKINYDLSAHFTQPHTHVYSL